VDSVRIGVTTFPFKEYLKNRHERGFKYLELRVSEAILVGRRVELAGELERTLDEYDLEVISVHVPEIRPNGHPVDFVSLDDETRAASIEIVESAISVAGSLNAPRLVLTLPPFLTQRQIYAQDPSNFSTLTRHRILNELEKFVNRADQEKLLLCLKNAPPIVEPGPAVGNFFGFASILEVHEILKRLSEFTRVWIAFDIANAHLLSNVWAAAREGDLRVAWLERMGIEVPQDIERIVSDLSELIEIFYLSNGRGFTEKGLLPEEGEMNLRRIYRHILTHIFPERIIILDAHEEHEEQAVNAELMSAYLRESG